MSKHRGTSHKQTLTKTKTQTFHEHLIELKRRFFYVGISVFIFSALAYSVERKLVAILLKPAGGQNFIYTNPGGGIDFLFRVCVYTGIVCSLPVLVYNTLRFIEPVINRPSWRFIILGSIASSLLAILGVMFGYFIGLPNALHFLFHQFTTIQIRPLVTIQSYLGFVMVYMVGSALMFQLPLLLIFFNRIRPLKPKTLIKYERWVVAAAFLIAGLMNPSPNIISLFVVAIPFILMYQVGILIIVTLNKSWKPAEYHNTKLADIKYIERQKKLKLIVALSRSVVSQSATAIYLSKPSTTIDTDNTPLAQRQANYRRDQNLDFAAAN